MRCAGEVEPHGDLLVVWRGFAVDGCAFGLWREFRREGGSGERTRCGEDGENVRGLRGICHGHSLGVKRDA